MFNVEIDKAIEFLQNFDHYPEYQRKLDYLIGAYYGAVSIKNSLKTYLETEIEDKERIVRELPDIGTVRDNSKLGMKIAYQDTLNRLKELDKREEKKLNK